MRGKWAAGIAPRNFTWVIRDRLALSERPGGFAPNHRRVRRQEELVWLRAQGFTKIVSLLPSQHNLQAYEDEKIPHAHYPLAPGADPRPSLRECFVDVGNSFHDDARILVHQEELGDRVMGVAAGFLVWSGRVPAEPQAIALVEHFVGHQMGPVGRELVVVAAALPPRAPV
ncbi:MAG: hypothetical protein ACRDWE_11715 [Acidimicrobiales bacterium]